MRKVAILACIWLLLPFAAWAAPHGQNGGKHHFVFSVAGNGWHFVMGPVKQKAEALWLFHGRPGVTPIAVSLTCRRATGDQAIIFVIRHPAHAMHGIVNADLSVAADTHPLKLRARTRNGQVILTSVSLAPAAIARAMGAIPLGQQADMTVHIAHMTEISIPVPAIRPASRAAAVICAGWSTKLGVGKS